jgi:hypothetical protein
MVMVMLMLETMLRVWVLPAVVKITSGTGFGNSFSLLLLGRLFLEMQR